MPTVTEADLMNVIAPDVIPFAHAKGVEHLLAPMVEMTYRVFPAGRLAVFLEEDWEIDNLKLIIFEVTLPAPPKESPIAEWSNLVIPLRQEWHRELLEICPAPLLLTFCLGVEISRS